MIATSTMCPCASVKHRISPAVPVVSWSYYTFASSSSSTAAATSLTERHSTQILHQSALLLELFIASALFSRYAINAISTRHNSIHRIRKKESAVRLSLHNINKFRPSFIIFDMKHPDDSFYRKMKTLLKYYHITTQ